MLLQEPLQEHPLHNSFHCWSDCDVPTLRPPFFPASLQLFFGTLILSWSRFSSRLQLLISSWSSCLWISLRLHRSRQHALHLFNLECNEYARNLASLELAWPIDPLCDYQWCSERRIFQHYSDCGGKCVWKSESGCRDGNDCDWLGWWLPDGESRNSFPAGKLANMK